MALNPEGNVWATVCSSPMVLHAFVSLVGTHRDDILRISNDSRILYHRMCAERLVNTFVKELNAPPPDDIILAVGILVNKLVNRGIVQFKINIC